MRAIKPLKSNVLVCSVVERRVTRWIKFLSLGFETWETNEWRLQSWVRLKCLQIMFEPRKAMHVACLWATTRTSHYFCAWRKQMSDRHTGATLCSARNIYHSFHPAQHNPHFKQTVLQTLWLFYGGGLNVSICSMYSRRIHRYSCFV